MTYDTERDTIMKTLSEDLAFLTTAMEEIRNTNGNTREYRALLKSYGEAAKLHLRLIKEVEAEKENPADALIEFAGQTSIYDEL